MNTETKDKVKVADTAKTVPVNGELLLKDIISKFHDCIYGKQWVQVDNPHNFEAGTINITRFETSVVQLIQTHFKFNSSNINEQESRVCVNCGDDQFYTQLFGDHKLKCASCGRLYKEISELVVKAKKVLAINAKGEKI